MTFIIAFLIEGLNSYRYSLQSTTYIRINETLASENPDDVYRVSCLERFKIFAVYFLSLFLSYMLMLIVMTFNAGLFLAAIFGLSAGYFAFGFVKRRGYTKIYAPETDKCCTDIE